MATVLNKKGFIDHLRAADGEAKRRFSMRVKEVIFTMHIEVEKLTPVWSGSALANWSWSIDAPDFTQLEPIDNGSPGHTNAMPLGPEPRRPPNTELSEASLFALNFSDPYHVFWLNNNDPDIMGLEAGELPPAPMRQRSPQGMVGLTLAYVVAKLDAGQM